MTEDVAEELCHWCGAGPAEHGEMWRCPSCSLWFGDRCLEAKRAEQTRDGEAATTCCPRCGATLLVEAV